MNNTKTLYLSSRLDRLSLEKDEPISSLNSKISTERDSQYYSLHILIITKTNSMPTLPVITDRTVQSTMLSITKLYVNQLMHIHNYYKASKIGIGVPLQTLKFLNHCKICTKSQWHVPISVSISISVPRAWSKWTIIPVENVNTNLYSNTHEEETHLCLAFDCPK